jgi:PAS domain-containing protein
MQSRLHYDVHTVQEALQENLRVRSALDKVRSCVTVFDRNNRLVYMNDTARSLFDEIGAHIRRENGEFVTDSLLGKNLAELFPDEGLRQTYRTELQETRESRLTAWGHTIRLVTTPVRDREGNYQGRVTQWIDITRELEEQERERIEEERRTAAANLRLKVALDNASSNVMVADEHRRIICMNDTAARLFKGIEEDVRKEIRDFEAGRIIGSTIDAFHKRSVHHQALVERMNSTHASGFEIAGHSMRFVANPVTDAEGRRLGTVVEWTDRTAEVAVEREKVTDAVPEHAASPAAWPSRQTAASRATPAAGRVSPASRSAPPSRPKAVAATAARRPAPAHADDGDEWEESEARPARHRGWVRAALVGRASPSAQPNLRPAQAAREEPIHRPVEIETVLLVVETVALVVLDHILDLDAA